MQGSYFVIIQFCEKYFMESRAYDLENRLVKFAILMLELCEDLHKLRISGNLAAQLSRSGTAPAMLYGEVQAAESRADFIHKMKLVLKELRETRITLRIIYEKPILSNDKIKSGLKEANELIGIFTQSVKTAKVNGVK